MLISFLPKVKLSGAKFSTAIIIALASTAAAAAPPTLHIVHEGQNISELRMIKQLRVQCVTEKNLYLDMRQRQPSTWSVVEHDMRKSRPDYDLQKALAPEPDWSKLAIVRDEEYFDGDRYAEYRESTRYKIVPDGSCELKAEPIRTADIDDGVNHYVVNITRGKGSKSPSAIIKQAHAKEQMQAQQAGLSAALAGFVPGLADAAVVASGQLKVVSQDTVAGERCDYLALSAGKGAQICYWSRMHTYPAKVPRSLVLKSKVRIGADENLTEAVVFDQTAKIDPKVFAPPNGVTLQERPMPR